MNRELTSGDVSGAERLRLLDRVLVMFKEVPAAAPPSIVSQVGAIVRIQPDTVSVSEAKVREDAVQTVDAYVADECDVRFSFEKLSFGDEQDGD